MARRRYIADGVGVGVVAAGSTGDEHVIFRSVDESAGSGQVVSMTWVT